MSQGIRHAPFITSDFRLKSRTLILSALPDIPEGTQEGVPVITVLLVSICQRSLSQKGNSGEYRGRTDDLLHAMQAL